MPPGLGPVYTYGDTRQTGDASVTLRTYSAEGVQQQDKIIYSHVLGHANDFVNYIRTAALNIALTAPELNDPVLMQEDNGSISYRFSWDAARAGDRSAALQRQADRYYRGRRKNRHSGQRGLRYAGESEYFPIVHHQRTTGSMPRLS